YNTRIAGGKWNGMMSWHPRDLPVFNMPKVADQDYLDSIQQVVKQELLKDKRTAIDISHFTAKHETATVHFNTIEGLGVSGKAVTTSPFKFQVDSIKNAPFLEYKLTLTPGTHAIFIKCLPTQSIDGDKKLLFGISFNNDSIQSINIHAESESKQWKENVLRGFTENKLVVIASKETNNLRIYFPEPGLVLSAIEVE
ncbi:MAG: hypothetical protein M3Y85_11160, partial [Bacteroidota bacterium]|nr:hypothetical protein [Bacteroidota bacterium]